MTESSPPNDPLAYQEWVKQLEQKWQAGLIPDPQTVAIILVNNRNEVLLQLRDNNPNISCPNAWTLPGGVVESPETLEQAAQRELAEETGLHLNLSLWKVYKRKPENRQFSIEQHIFIGTTHRESDEMILGEGQALHFFGRDKLPSISIAFDFDKILFEFFDQGPEFLPAPATMQILTEIFRDQGLNIHGKTDHRTAVRAVVIRERKLLMVYSPVNGDYKFPGGGVDESEDHEAALKREIAEECGMNLTRILGEIGCIVEYAMPMKSEFDVFKMTSSYYLCEVDSVIGTQHLDAYEEDLGFQPIWIDIDVAIQTNKAVLQSETKKPPQWTAREVFMLEHIRKNLL